MKCKCGLEILSENSGMLLLSNGVGEEFHCLDALRLTEEETKFYDDQVRHRFGYFNKFYNESSCFGTGGKIVQGLSWTGNIPELMEGKQIPYKEMRKKFYIGKA